MQVIFRVVYFKAGFFILLIIFNIFFSNPLYAAPACGSLENAYGPFDYTNPDDFKNKLPLVEIAHFTPKVEGLMGGKSGYLWGDLDYTLRAFPNHHRALYAFVRYEIREREKARAKGETYR